MRLCKPTIAAITGYAVAGGLELALWCDLRVIDKSAVFGVFCRRWGVPLIDGGTIRLPRLIGESRALDLILTGREVGAEEALSIGLANRLVETGTVLQKSIELAEQIAQFPQVAMRNDRLSTLEQSGMTLEDAMYNEFTHGLVSLSDGVILPMVRPEDIFPSPEVNSDPSEEVDSSGTG
jgi:enoyl-CoA hydratase